jgi:hypothetical protein
MTGKVMHTESTTGGAATCVPRSSVAVPVGLDMHMGSTNISTQWNIFNEDPGVIALRWMTEETRSQEQERIPEYDVLQFTFMPLI